MFRPKLKSLAHHTRNTRDDLLLRHFMLLPRNLPLHQFVKKA